MLTIIKSNEDKGLYEKLSIVIALFSYPMMILTCCGKHNNCYSILVSRSCIIILIIFSKIYFSIDLSTLSRDLFFPLNLNRIKNNLH